jgi:conjugative transposon TraM protein
MNMETTMHSQKFLRQRKFMTVLTLLVLPFITIIFAALGGGRGSASASSIKQQGINTLLPDAHFKKGKEKNKLGIYEDMSKDSARLKEQMKNDPYYMPEFHEGEGISGGSAQLQNIFAHSGSKYGEPGFSKLQTSTTNAQADSNEQKVVKKLQELKNVLSKSSSPDNPQNPSSYHYQNAPGPDMIKMQNMMQAISARGNEPDPQVNQLNGMLDKIMLIQYPEKLQDSMRSLSEKNKKQTFLVTTAAVDDGATLLDTQKTSMKPTASFFSINDEEGKMEDKKQNTIEAVVPESQTIVLGGTVRLRLLSDIYVAGIKIPKDEFVYGTGTLNGERLKIAISSLRYQNNILPVSLEVYDLDGMAGIYMPGSITRDVSKQSADDAISSVGLTTVDPSIGAQAASAGIEAAKTLASKKIKLVRVNIPSGYNLLLKDTNQKN